MSVKVTADLDRILARCEMGDCWEWTGGKCKDGYGRTHKGSRAAGTFHTVIVHRFVYESLCGVSLRGLQIDHLCRNRKCCNPCHLEPVTLHENLRRGYRAILGAHCSHGHEYTPANTAPGAKNGRVCRVCQRASVRRYQQKKAEYR